MFGPSGGGSYLIDARATKTNLPLLRKYIRGQTWFEVRRPDEVTTKGEEIIKKFLPDEIIILADRSNQGHLERLRRSLPKGNKPRVEIVVA
jgi:hypothetical protein